MEFEDTPDWLDEALNKAKERRKRPPKPFSLTDREMLKVSQVASRQAWKWKQDKDDLEQTLLLWCFERPGTIERFREREFGEGAFVLSLKRVAVKYCVKETRHDIGKSLDDEELASF
jgi:hypothetical protein